MTLRAVALAVRFTLEMVSLWVFGYWGVHLAGGFWSSVGLGLGIPLVVVLIWGGLIAPKAKVPWSQGVRDFLGFLVFALASLFLYSMDRSRSALVLLMVALIDTALLLLKPGPSRTPYHPMPVHPEAPEYEEPEE